MGRALVPLSMSTIGQIPGRCRSCVAWEVAGARPAFADPDPEPGELPELTEPPGRPGPREQMAERAFEKEVWLSGVMLTWGSAGLIATVDDQPAGFVLYAPPTAVPAAAAFPTGPVSPDAVLMTGARVLPDFAGQGLGRYLMTGMVSALVRRGVRAIEAFGLDDAAPPGHGLFGRRRRSTTEGDVEVPGCLVPASFLRVVGFSDVQPHHRYPRLRYELESGINWKAEVEAALEKLFTETVLTGTPNRSADLVGAATATASCSRAGRKGLATPPVVGHD